MSVATTYAKALFEAGKEKKEDLEKLEQQLDQMLAMLKDSRDLEIALLGPLVSARDKIGVLEELSKKAQFSPLVGDFLALLARKNRLPVLRQIREAFSAVRIDGAGGISAKLVSAETMSAKDLQEIAAALAKKTGKKVALRASVDPALIAGMKVTMGGVTYDGTLRSQLERLRDKVTQGLTAATGRN